MTQTGHDGSGPHTIESFLTQTRRNNYLGNRELAPGTHHSIHKFPGSSSAYLLTPYVDSIAVAGLRLGAGSGSWDSVTNASLWSGQTGSFASCSAALTRRLGVGPLSSQPRCSAVSFSANSSVEPSRKPPARSSPPGL